MATQRILLVLSAIGLGQFAALAETSPIAHVNFKYGKAAYEAIVADLATAQVSVEAVHSKKLQSFWQLTAQTRPVAAITGTFFNPRCGAPVGDVLVDGSLVAKGYRGSVIAVDWNGKAKVFDTKFGESVDWTDYRYALRGTVRLIRDGVVSPNPVAQKFKDRAIWGRARRAAVGVTKAGKLVMIGTRHSVTLSELGRAMKTLGVVDAVNLDGGSSTTMFYRGELLIAPARKLSNLLVIREQSPVIQDASQLPPIHMDNRAIKR